MPLPTPKYIPDGPVSTEARGEMMTLLLQVMYVSGVVNARGRNIQTVEVAIEDAAILVSEGVLSCCVRAVDAQGVYQPLQRVHEFDHVALVRIPVDFESNWFLFPYDDEQVKPLNPNVPFADLSLQAPYPLPLKQATIFDGIAVSLADWQEVLNEIDERQRQPTE